MAWGLFDIFKKKRPSSQPPVPPGDGSFKKKNSKKEKKLTNSVPNLSSEASNEQNQTPQTSRNNTANNYKSFGEFAQQDSEDEMNTNFSPRHKTLGQLIKSTPILNDSANGSGPVSATAKISKSTGDYESSETSESKKSSSIDLNHLNTLNPDGMKVDTFSVKNSSIADTGSTISDASPKSLSQRIKEAQNRKQQPLKPVAQSTSNNINQTETNKLPAGATSPIGTGYTILKTNTSQTVTFKEPESQSKSVNETVVAKSQTADMITTETIQKLINNFDIDKNKMAQLNKDNKNLQKKIDELQSQILEMKAKEKYDIDLLMAKFHDGLKNQTEKEEMKKLFITKQQETNEKVMNEQARIIESLKSKCKKIETELEKSNESSKTKQINELKEEISTLKMIIHRLNIELSAMQAKYSSVNTNPNGLTGLPKDSPTPIWLVDTKYLSPLIAAYDERLAEKDEKLRLMKNKIDDLANKFKLIIDENNELHAKCEKVPENFFSQLEKIKEHAELVLEENQILKEQLELNEKKIFEIERRHIQEIGRLSKRIIVNESERVNLLNQVDIYKENHEEVIRKYNDLSLETQRRISMEEYLNETGDLKRKLSEISVAHKQELEKNILLLQDAQNEKKDLMIKLTSLMGENKKLKAENEVVERELEKTQKRIQSLQKKLEIAELNEKNAYLCLEKVTKQLEKLKIERETYLNMAKSNEMEAKINENKYTEESIKASKLEDKLMEFKDKAANKLAKAVHKMQLKDTEFISTKLENEKKFAEMVSLLQKKQEKINELIKEKKFEMNSHMELQLESVLKMTSSDNQRLKEVLLDIKTKS